MVLSKHLPFLAAVLLGVTTRASGLSRSLQDLAARDNIESAEGSGYALQARDENAYIKYDLLTRSPSVAAKPKGDAQPKPAGQHKPDGRHKATGQHKAASRHMGGAGRKKAAGQERTKQEQSEREKSKKERAERKKARREKAKQQAWEKKKGEIFDLYYNP